MLRFAVLLVLALLLYLVLRAALAALAARVGGARGAAEAVRDELVKDPVCETYVPRTSAVARRAGPTTYYFCSRACAEKFRLPS